MTAPTLVSAAHIVVGVDGSPASVEAIRWAARQAELTDATLDAVISWHYPHQYGGEFYGETVDWAELAQGTPDTALTEAGDDAHLNYTCTVTEGYPAEVLIAASTRADLVVVGSRGHGGFAGLLLGSVSEKVVAHAACPVLVVRHPHDEVAQP